VATFISSCEALQSMPFIAGEAHSWYALQTRARHEKSVAHRLEESGITAFLPLVAETHRWSDRKKVVEVPLFGCYVFARIAPTNADRLRLLQTDGVLSLLGKRGEGTPIPDGQIDSIRILLGEKMPWGAHPFLQIGQRVRIRSGALSGMEGVLVSRNGERTLVLSVDAIQRSLAVRVQGYEVEPV
jgi:transcription antitermination factor NusG